MKVSGRKVKSKKQKSSGAVRCVVTFIFLAALFALLQISVNAPFSRNASAEDLNAEINDAIYARQEFFGATAIVAVPTRERRENLWRLNEEYPDNQIVLERLADANEKLLRFDEAESNLIHLTEIDFAANQTLADFYERRGAFEKEAVVLEKILFSTAPEKRVAAFENLIRLAETHDLKQYRESEFYARVVEANADFYPIFADLIERSMENEDYNEALNFLRQAKIRFPEKSKSLLDKEIEILLALKQPKEAEAIYRAAFDPFWSDEEARQFYAFLSDRDHLRLYGAEMNNRFKKNPADFDAAMRLADYQMHDYAYGNDDIAPIIAKLEAAKKDWTTEELVVATRMLLRQNAGETASRFLYTLYLREDFQKNSEFRARVLYQLFEMFSDAENIRLPLTRGDLSFYEDVARADTNPGIATGILSLIFSDTNPREKLAAQETEATLYFNRAAAYRIFLEYKKEFPTSNELAQMYLDIVRLYTTTGEKEIAAETLDEFAARYENATDFPAAALKLADAFTAAKQPEKTRETYQKILDHIGKQGKPLAPVKIKSAETSADFQTSSVAPTTRISDEKPSAETVVRNLGVNIPKASAAPRNSYYDDEPTSRFNDFLAPETDKINYAEVLEKYVAALAGEKKTAEILALYSKEIEKYPNEEWLYEKRLAWLEQTNLTSEKLQMYRTAFARFQTNGWRDKLARFFLRQNQTDDFKNFSEDLIGKLSEAEIAEFVSQTVEPNLSNSARVLDKKILLALLESARRRFPRNVEFVKNLLRFYKTNDYKTEWRNLAAEFYFESKDIRTQFLNDLAEKKELRTYLEKSKDKTDLIYEIFRADASARLSDFENAVAAYRKLNDLYPNTPEFSARLINFTRSFGQKNLESLREAATLAKTQADFSTNRTDLRTSSGEIFAELGDYENARAEWQKLTDAARGEKNNYLATATVYWDYFQYDDALRTIGEARKKFDDDALYAFESGVIFEAQHKQNDALNEYVKALDADDEETQKENAEKRLAKLFSRAEGKGDLPAKQFLKTLDTTFEIERRKRQRSSQLALGYAETLFKIRQNERAASILNRAVSQTSDTDFLKEARDFYASEDLNAGEQFVLKRLADVSENPRSKIMFALQLAESYETEKRPADAKKILANLVRNFPTNYGVLIETANFYARLGDDNKAASILQNALPASRGYYREKLAANLASRLIRLDKLASAEQILLDLHNQNKADATIFQQLAAIYTRRGESENLRQVFAETAAALKASDVDRRELDDQIGDLRGRMIDAFTKLGDYKSAVEQHIEIINREPENEELTENAIHYVKRYGGAETLLNYYQKTSAEAFKNYRWNVVLARIYEASNDAENAIKNYQAAIVNQPEMPELYDAIADIELKRNNFDAALKNLDRVLELTNDAPEFVKKKIEVLKRADRLAEIETERAKLPAETKIDLPVDRFAEAAKLAASEREEARESYKHAFAALLENPLQADFKAADLNAYARIVRDEKLLAEVYIDFWTLREKLTTIADESNSTDAGEARKRLSTLDAAIVESIGGIAKTVATDEELANLHEDLRVRIEDASPGTENQNKVQAIVQNLARRAGFGDLEEEILVKKLEAADTFDSKKSRLKNLTDFYDERGAYQKTFDALEKFGGDDLAQKAEVARLVGNREKELEALRAIYWQPEKTGAAANEKVARYLEVLRADHRDELESLTGKTSVYQIQLINFLLGAGEAALAHRAIENANLSKVWKVSRGAETSLALREFGEAAECYFCDALQFDSIGNLIGQTPDKKNFLVNDDWFRLTREYGEWLFEKNNLTKIVPENSALAPDKFLAAMTENFPDNADEQFKLGEFYLERNETAKAIEHLRLAIEVENAASDDQLKAATLAAAYLKNNRRDEAENLTAEILADENLQSAAIYFNAMRKYGFESQARVVLPEIIIKFLIDDNAENSPEFQSLIRLIAASFADENDKAKYFSDIVRTRPTDVSLAKMLVEENLIAREKQSEFYELIIEREEKSASSDYRFAEIFQRVWKNTADAESIYDQENKYEIEEPNDSRFQYQKQFLELLVERRENDRAEKLSAEIEKELAGRYARPEWLRLANIRLQIRRGDSTLIEAKRLTGITVADAATKINPPSSERFNTVLEILTEENALTDTARLNESFFARMLALGRLDAAHFIGLARTFFRMGDAENALRVLRLLTNAGDAEKREIALAEIDALEPVKANAADAAKITATETADSLNRAENLKLAAETALEFDQIDAAIEFRRLLLEANPTDATNKLELAKLLLRKEDKNGATNLLNEILNDQNTLRQMRWQARLILIEAGASATLPDVKFDVFSQFYAGTFAAKNGQINFAGEFFTNALIADQAAEINTRQELIKQYIADEKFFAALKLAAADKALKSDDLLDALGEAARRSGDFAKAVEFEQAKSGGGNAEKIRELQNALAEKLKRATDFQIDLENTRKL